MTIGSFRLNTIAAAAASPYGVVATGGNTGPEYSYDTNNSKFYKLHKFTSIGSANFTVSVGGTVEALLVGGGGGGGGKPAGTSYTGGGGGGQVLYSTTNNISVTPQTYTITVGTSGTGGANTGANGGDGGSTTAFGFTASGGLGGKYSAGIGGAGGASGSFTGGTSTNTAGGGGASHLSNGGNGSPTVGGNGAAGITGLDFIGSTQPSGASPVTAFGGGGGGAASSTQGTGGTGGGGAGSLGAGNSGAINTGGGGGGVGSSSLSTGGAGGTGFAAVRYQVDPATLTYSFVTSATSTAATITIPATAAIGDIAILVDVASNTTTTIPTTTIATGFTSIIQGTIGTTLGRVARIEYKVLVSGDPGSTVTGCSGASQQKVMLIYRPSFTIQIPTTASTFYQMYTQQNTDAALTNTNLAFTSVVGPYIGIAMYAAGAGSVTGRSTGLGHTREIAVGTNLYVQTFEANSTTTSFTTQTQTMSDSGTNSMMSGMIRFITYQ
jgi:hypothetical protein